MADPLHLQTFVSQAIERSRLRVATEIHFGQANPAAVAGPAVARGTFVGQAIDRARLRVPTEIHYGVADPPASVVVGEDPFVLGFLISQAVVGAKAFRRPLLRPHLARPIVGAAASTTPVARGTFVSVADIGRSLRRPAPPRAHLARPIVGAVAVAPFPPARIVSQAVKRATLRRTQDLHLAPANLTPAVEPPAGGDPQLLQVQVNATLERSRLRPNLIRPHLAPALVSPAVFDAIVAQIMVTRQARERSLRRPLPLRPHLAPVNLTQPVPPAPVVTKPYVVSQAVDRATLRRLPIEPHVARPIVAPYQDPFVLQTIVTSQAHQRPNLGRTVPKPHVARPIIGAGTVPPLVTRPRIVGQAVNRSTRRPLPDSPHVAAPNLTPAETTLIASTVVGQAIERSRYRPRTAQRPVVARPIVSPYDDPFVLQTQVTFQARQRMLTRRSGPRPHLAPPNLTAPVAGLVQFDNDRFEQRIRNARFLMRVNHDPFEQQTSNTRFTGAK